VADSAPSPSPDERPPTTEEERERFIAELERDLDRRRVGVLPPVAAAALAGSLFLMWWMSADVQYFFSSREAIELGAEGDYHLERAVENRYAQVHGVPAARGWYTMEKDGEFVVLSITDTALLVRRSTFQDEQVTRDGKRPQPRQNPFFAKGRLLSRQAAAKYAEVFAGFEQWSGSAPQWLLIAEQSPGRDLSTVAMFGFLGAFALLNAWLMVRGLRPRRE
jgi:hypothetical protein